MAGEVDEAQITCPRCRAHVPATAVFCPECGGSTIPDRDPTPELPGYRILRPLGRGGAAVVYLARQEALDREVAIKLLRRDVDDPKVWREFQREAHAIARLSAHPHVVTVYTAGRSALGQPYLVTEYLDRGSLADVIADHPLDPRQVVAIGVAVADALAAAHRVGILHRDVKPGNVLLAHDGRIKLGDFGIARLLVGRSAATTDRIAFTPEHVAPEVLRHEPDGPWSDVYGLASTVATALVGSPLFQQRPDESLQAFLSRKVLASAPVVGDAAPGVLAEVLTRALDPDPTHRPSVDELRQQLADAAASLPSSGSLPPPTPRPAADPPAERPPVAALSATSAATARHDVDAPGRPDAGLRSGPPRRRREIVPTLIAALVATLALAALGVVLLTAGDSDQAGDRPADPASSPAPASVAPVPTPALAPVSAPATTAAAAPPQAAPATTAAAAAPLPAPATSAAPTPAALVTPAEAETFVRGYYDALAGGDYERTWSQLTPEFQRGKARSYDYYVDFWDDNDVAVDDVELVEADASTAVVHVRLRWNGSGDAVTDRFELRSGPEGQPLIADQDTIGS